MASAGQAESHSSPRVGVMVLLATGSALMMMGAVFLAPFLLDPRVQQNDVFLTNLFVGPPFFVAGSALFIASAARLGIAALPLAACWLINALLTSGVGWAAGAAGADVIPLYAAATVLDVLLLIAVSAALYWRPQRLATWAEGLVIGAAMTSAATLGYFAIGGRYLAAGETVSSLPPYLNLATIVLGMLLAAAAAITAWAMARR